MNQIHPTSIIEEGAELGTGNVIGPFCYIGPAVRLGDGNRLEAYVSIGTPPEDRASYTDHRSGVVIGDGCVVREFVTINDGIDRPTVVDDGAQLLAKAHIGHDSVLEPRVTLACAVLVGGRSHVQSDANIGLGTAIHQMQVIGSLAMLGMNSTVTKKSVVECFTTYVGNPVRPVGRNEIGLQRSGLSPGEQQRRIEQFEALRADPDHFLRPYAR